ncbi:cystathionine beta-lyase [Comamonas serinivorans]|uniref:Cystathionine beta-lyase n=1 Tax=Comamonas serinivorans TaxID=1082851 RepID=A0A1Y0EMT5_9BURK|nr:PLP-dependent transferase [Comamonas serinivorans]ARU04965.1 cystathionine beta-lyase [Comamonas serinivorans]
MSDTPSPALPKPHAPLHAQPASATELIHHPYQPPTVFAAPTFGVHKASTVLFDSVAAMRDTTWMDKSGYTYGLHGTPTSFLLEERICALEGGLQTLLVPSGLAALALVPMALLKAGDELLMPDNAYGPNKSLAEGELRNWGITHQFYDPMNPDDLAARISDKTRLVWLEAAGSVTLEFPDLPALARICRERGVTTALDNTWGAGIAFNPFDFGDGWGADISAHALTKYPSGGGDVLMGSVTTRDALLHKKLKLAHMRLGLGVGMNDVEMVLRSLPTVHLRYGAADRSARALARWASQQPAFVQVLHPALPGSPGHDHWRRLCAPAQARADAGDDSGAAASLFSVMLDPGCSPAQVDAFCDALRLFRLGYSWGGPISLVVPYHLDEMRSLPTTLTPGHLIRFAVGLERTADLQADLAQALSHALR